MTNNFRRIILTLTSKNINEHPRFLPLMKNSWIVLCFLISVIKSSKIINICSLGLSSFNAGSFSKSSWTSINPFDLSPKNWYSGSSRLLQNINILSNVPFPLQKRLIELVMNCSFRFRWVLLQGFEMVCRNGVNHN